MNQHCNSAYFLLWEFVNNQLHNISGEKWNWIMNFKGATLLDHKISWVYTKLPKTSQALLAHPSNPPSKSGKRIEISISITYKLLVSHLVRDLAIFSFFLLGMKTKTRKISEAGEKQKICEPTRQTNSVPIYSTLYTSERPSYEMRFTRWASPGTGSYHTRPHTATGPTARPARSGLTWGPCDPISPCWTLLPWRSNCLGEPTPAHWR